MRSTTDFDLWLCDADVSESCEYESARDALENPGVKRDGFLAVRRDGQLYLHRDGCLCVLRLASERARNAFLGLLDSMCVWA